MENHINIFIVSKVLGIYRFERIRAGESRIRKRPRGGTQFSAVVVAFASGHEFSLDAPRPEQKPCPSTLGGSRAWNQNFNSRIPVRILWRLREEQREMKRQREIRGEARAFTSLARVYFLRETIEGNLFPGCFHDCLLPLVLTGSRWLRRVNRVNYADTKLAHMRAA